MSAGERIGAMSARIRLESPAGEMDDLGGRAIGWTSQGEVWASIEPGTSAEAVAYDGLGGRARYAIGIRAREDVRPGWRAVWGGRIFRIRMRIDDEPGFQILDCEEEIL